MSRPLRWDTDGRDWPNRHASRFVRAGAITWHVQQTGEGPLVLLLHGTGASTHSWRDLMPLLAQTMNVIAPDLPGHGFTCGRPARGLTLAGIADAVSDLMDALECELGLVIGHSAGVAIAMQCALSGRSSSPIVGLNPAIMPFAGLAAQLAPAMARVLFLNPFMPRIFARTARVPGQTAQFLRRSTGSQIDAGGLHYYETLFGNAAHCRGVLEMMANWDLAGFSRRLPEMGSPLLLIHSEGDRAIPLDSVRQAALRLPDCRLEILARLGHLAHEEDPQQIVRLILGYAQEQGLFQGEGGTP